jgi:hypothetical protein
MGKFIPPASVGYAAHAGGDGRAERLHRIEARKRYIDAKLRKFELDQVTAPFSRTRMDQGLDRALTGAFQKLSLKATGQYESYVRKQQRLIDHDREIVEAYEEINGRETGTRTLYHGIRESPDTKTYRDTRRAFKKIKHELNKQELSELESNVQRGAHGLLEWARYNRHGITAVTAGLVAFLAVGIPSHSYWERKDHNRPVSYKKYKDDLYGALNSTGDESFRLHPMTRMAISAHNLEMYLHDTWNRSHNLSAASVEAQEWDDFIKPDANPSVLKKLHNWAGNDYTRPYAHIFLDAKDIAQKHMAPTVKPVRAIAHGTNEMGNSWTYRTWDDTHEDCTTDSEGNESCTTVCDRTHHKWTLDTGRYLNGVSAIHNGRRQFPQLEAARLNGLLETPNTLGLLLTGNNIDEVHEKVTHYNKWASSIMIRGYNQLLGDAGSLRSSGLPEFFFENERALPESFHNINPLCGGPTEYPFGWHENKRLQTQAGSVVSGFSRISDSFNKFDTVVPRIERDMDVLREVRSYGGKTNSALRDIGNLAYELGNANMKGSEWHPTYGQRIALELLAYLAIGAMAGGAAYGVGRRAADYGWRRRMGRAGLY